MMKTLRSTLKTIVLLVSLIESLIRFALLRVRLFLMEHRCPTPTERAMWLHGCCRRILKRLRLQLGTNAGLPERGMVVSNHLSHLDILLYASLGPIIFVAKEEVRHWPILGKLAECGGSIFVDRANPAQAAIAAQQMEACLRSDVPILLFPEGTSSDGSTVLPFRSSLFEPAMRAGAGITCSAISYSAESIEESALTYWGDKVFFPHLYATLGCKQLAASILFAPESRYQNRKQAAKRTHDEVEELRGQRASDAAHTPESAASGVIRIFAS